MLKIGIILMMDIQGEINLNLDQLSAGEKDKLEMEMMELDM